VWVGGRAPALAPAPARESRALRVGLPMQHFLFSVSPLVSLKGRSKIKLFSTQFHESFIHIELHTIYNICTNGDMLKFTREEDLDFMG